MLIDFRTLFPKYRIAPKGIMHVGANVGEEAPVYLQLGIKKQIWIEANPEIFLKLKANISNNPEAVAFNFAAGDEDKETVLHISNNGSQSSSLLELGTHKIAHPDVHYVSDVTVQMLRLDHFFLHSAALQDVDFLNCDIQGAELMALRGMGDLLKQFKWIYTEVNIREVYKGCALLPDMDLFMIANGFKRRETFGEHSFLERLGWSDALYSR